MIGVKIMFATTAAWRPPNAWGARVPLHDRGAEW